MDGETTFEGAATFVLVGDVATLRAKPQALPDASPTDCLLGSGRAPPESANS